MSLASDIAGDWTIFDNVEDVTLDRRTGADIPGIKALRRATDRRTQSAFANLSIQADDATIHLWAATITGGYEPKINDVIVDASSRRWTILGIHPETFDGRYRCLCRKEK